MGRLAILAQFDPAGGVPPFVREHLKGLRPVADKLVLVSNSPVSRQARAEVAGLCEDVVERPNLGWDFAGWRDVLASEDMERWDGVILTNSSVIGPLYPLLPIVERMEAGATVDFWGLVRSHQMRAHLQSYFLAFGPDIIRSGAWRAFWRGVGDIASKEKVIRRYETGMTGQFERAGFRSAALMQNPRFPQSIRMIHSNYLKAFTRVPFNVNYANRTVEQHDELIEQGFPYLKASLLWGKDTYRLRNFDRIRELTADHFNWDAIGGDWT